MYAHQPLDFLALARRVIAGGEITRDEGRALFSLDVTSDEIYDLFYAAHKVRRHFHGNRVTFCSIVASKFGSCSEDCKFCAQSAHFDTGITSHPMMARDEVKGVCTDARDRGASAFGIVNSGRGPNKKEWPAILEAIRGMKEVEGICHCATLGELTPEQAQDLKAAGIRRVNHNLETSREFYPQIVSTHTWHDRVRTLRIAREAGLELCTGGIFGMGETIEDRVSLAFSLKEINPQVTPLNFLNPIPGTPLEKAPPLRPLEILQIVATMRLILPRADLKVAGGREKNLRDLQSWIFYVGGTSAIIGNYLATLGRKNEDDLQMADDLEMSWHPDRVGDVDPGVFTELSEMAELPEPGGRGLSLPVL
jgi:biotin synthase